MLKLDFFLAAMAAGEYKRKAWVISAFTLISEDPDAWEKKKYPYRIVQTPSGHYFVDPNNDNQLTQIKDAVAGKPLFVFNEHVMIGNEDDVPNKSMVRGTGRIIDTTYGRLLVNFAAIVYAFDKKINFNFINKPLTPSVLEDLIITRLKDTPKEGEKRNDEDIYVDEYLKFSDAMFYLAGFTQICVPASTRKTMTAAPGIVELKEKLLEENKDRLHDPAVVAKIDAELVKFDKDYMKGDRGEGFLISGKSYNIVRKKLFGMHGAEVSLDEGVNVDLIENSLSQGWDINKFPTMNNSLRAGSFNRGAQTMLGGVSVKELLRASSNVSVTEADCGTKLGITMQIDGTNYTKLTGFNLLVNGTNVLVPTDEDAKGYIGKEVMVRSPMFCKLEKTDYCSCCVGKRLADNPKGLSTAIAEVGSSFLNIFMSAGHSKGLMLAKMDYKTEIQ